MKKRWLIVLLILAIIFVGTGFYLKTEPDWTRKTYYDYYNQGVLVNPEKQTRDAINSFAYVADNSTDPWLESLALTQVGTLIGKQSFEEGLSAESRYEAAQYAIAILEVAVVNDPDNGEAKYNLELLKNKLPDLSQQMEEESNENGGDKQGSDPSYGHGGGERGY